MAYRYMAYTKDKIIMRGTIDAVSEAVAEEALYQAGYSHILSLVEANPTPSLQQWLLSQLTMIRSQDVINFSRELATLVESGVSIITALDMLTEHCSGKALKKAITGLSAGIQGGASFSNAAGKYPQLFSATHCQVLQASERSGSLELGLKHIADDIERRTELKKTVQRALTYPIMVLVLAIAVSALLVTVVMPPLVRMFVSLNMDLPLTTRLVMGAGNFLNNYKLNVLQGALILFILIAVFSRLPRGKLAIDRWKLRIPLIGTTILQHNLGYFCQTTSMMLQAGIMLPQVLANVNQTIGNKVIRQALSEVREKLIQGQGLSQPMSAIELFPRFLVEMVAVGEKSGNLESTLATSAMHYQRRIQQSITMLTSLIEPVLTLVVGIVVATLALSIIGPIYSLVGQMR